MDDERQIIIGNDRQLLTDRLFDYVPVLFRNAGENARVRFVEFFAANIRNKNTRMAYGQAVRRFCVWCERHKLELHQLSPTLVAAYIEEVGRELSAPSVKQHLAAIRMLFDYLVIGHGMINNPAASVRGPKHVVTKGKTPVLTPGQARLLLDSIDASSISFASFLPPSTDLEAVFLDRRILLGRPRNSRKAKARADRGEQPASGISGGNA